MYIDHSPSGGSSPGGGAAAGPQFTLNSIASDKLGAVPVRSAQFRQQRIHEGSNAKTVAISVFPSKHAERARFDGSNLPLGSRKSSLLFLTGKL
jgi:hypothetical protein